MSKGLLFAIMIAILAGVGYFVLTPDSTEVTSIAGSAPETVTEDTAPAGDAANAVAEAGSDAAAAVEETGNEIAAAASDAVENATDAVTETVEAATDAVNEAVETATDTATAALSEDAATGATSPAEEPASIADLLTVETFDFAKVKEALESSSLGALETTTLISALEAAEGSPDVLAQVLERVREALNL